MTPASHIARLVGLAGLCLGFCTPSVALAAKGRPSRAIRGDHVAYALGEPPDGAYSFWPPVANWGLTAGLFAHEQAAIEVATTGGRAVGGQAEAFAQISFLRYRRWLGNSLNVAVGAGYRTLEFNWYQNAATDSTYDPVLPKSQRHSRMRRTDAGTTVAFGSMWQGEVVTWGFD